MLRCPEQPTIRSPARPEVTNGHIRRDGSDQNGNYNESRVTNNGGRASVSSASSFEAGADGRRPQQRGERDGQSTDSGISDISDREDEHHAKHLLQGIANGLLTRNGPPNSVVRADGTVHCVKSPYHHGVSGTTASHATHSPRPPLVSNGEQFRKRVDSPSETPHQGKKTSCILNPAAGLHGPGKFRDDPKMVAKFVGMDGAAAAPLDLTASRSSHSGSTPVTAQPPSAHQHPSIAACLKRPMENAIKPLIDRFGSRFNDATPELRPPSTPSERPNSRPSSAKMGEKPNSGPSSAKMNANVRPSSQPHVAHSPHQNGNIDPMKVDRGLRSGNGQITAQPPKRSSLSGKDVETLPQPVQKQLFNTTMASRPLSNALMQQLCDNERWPKNRLNVPHTDGTPVSVMRSSPISHAPPPVRGPSPNQGMAHQVTGTHTNPMHAQVPMNTTELINTSVMSNGNTTQKANQMNTSLPEHSRQSGPNFQHNPQMATQNRFAGECQPQMFHPYFTPPFQQRPPFPYQNFPSNMVPMQAMQQQECANYYAGRFPGPAPNQLYQMYQMKPQMMPVPQQESSYNEAVRQGKPKRKYTRKKDVSGAPIIDPAQATVDTIISNIIVECQSKKSSGVGAGNVAQVTREPSSLSNHPGQVAISQPSSVHPNCVQNKFDQSTDYAKTYAQLNNRTVSSPRPTNASSVTVQYTGAIRRRSGEGRTPEKPHDTPNKPDPRTMISSDLNRVEHAKMKYEGLGDTCRIEYQRSFSAPDTSQKKEIVSPELSRSHNAGLEKTTPLAKIVEARTQPSPDSGRQSTSPKDQGPSYHRALPKKRHLFEKHDSDPNIVPPKDLETPKEPTSEDAKRTETTQQFQPEEEYGVHTNRDSKQSETFEKHVHVQPDVALKSQNENSALKLKLEAPAMSYMSRGLTNIDLNAPQLEDSSQNQRPMAPVPNLFNYRFRPPNLVPHQGPRTRGQAPQMASPWRHMMPVRACAPRMALYRPPGYMNPDPSQACAPTPGDQPPRFDMKEKIAVYLKEKREKQAEDPNRTVSSQAANHTQRPVAPQMVPLYFTQENNGKPMPQNFIPVFPVNMPLSNVRHPVQFVSPQGPRMHVGEAYTEQPTPPGFIPIRPKAATSMPQGPYSADKSKATTAESDKLLTTMLPASHGLDGVVVNTRKMNGIEGVVLKVDERDPKKDKTHRKRGQKRKEIDNLVPENVFVRAVERRKRLKLLPTPEALAKGGEDGPSSLTILASKVFSKLEDKEHYIRLYNSASHSHADDASVSKTYRIAQKPAEDLTEDMIASMVNEACAMRQCRKAGIQHTPGSHSDYGHSISQSGMAMPLKAIENRGAPAGVSTLPPQNLFWATVPEGQDIMMMNVPHGVENEQSSAHNRQKQRSYSGDADHRQEVRGLGVKHYRPKSMMRPKARIEDISEIIDEVVRESADEAETVGKDAVKDVSGDEDDTVKIGVDTTKRLEDEIEKERIDYEAKLQEILHPKVPNVVNEILEDMQLELRGSMPEVEETRDSDSGDSSDDESSGSESDDGAGDVDLGTVVIDGKEYRMRAIVDEDDVDDDSESDSEYSASSSRPMSRASTKSSIESYVEEGVDTFQNIEMLDEDDDDVFADSEEPMDSNRRDDSDWSSDAESVGGIGRAHKRTRSYCSSSSSSSSTSSSSSESEDDRDAEEVQTMTSEEEEEVEAAPRLPSPPPEELTINEQDTALKEEGKTRAEDGESSEEATERDEVYIIDNFSYTDETGIRHKAINENRITDAFEVHDTVGHPVDIELVKHCPFKRSESLFERFGMNHIQTDPKMPDSLEHSCMPTIYIDDVDSDLHRDSLESLELECPKLSPRPGLSPRSATAGSNLTPSPVLTLDTSTESDAMPVLLPCVVDGDPLLRSPCEEPPVLQFIGKSRRDKSPNAKSSNVQLVSSALGIPRKIGYQNGKLTFKKRKKPKMICLTHKTADSYDDNEKENTDNICSGLKKPEYRPPITSSSPCIPDRSADSNRKRGDCEPFLSSNCEFLSLSQSPIEARSRPFSPLNCINPRSNQEEMTFFDHCSSCRKNGKLKSPNRLHSRDDICPYFRYSRSKHYLDRNYYYSSSDDHDVPRYTEYPALGYKTDFGKIVQPKGAGSVSNGKHPEGKMPHSVCDLNDIIYDRLGDFVPENISDTYPRDKLTDDLQDLSHHNGPTDVLSHKSNALSSTASVTTPIRIDCDADSHLNQLDTSSDGTDLSLYRDNNGCDDYLYSSFESPTRLSGSMNLSKVESDSESDSDTDSSDVQSDFLGETDSSIDSECEAVQDIVSQSQKCWVDLCDIKDFLQGQFRVKIHDFVSYNESLCRKPVVSEYDVTAMDDVTTMDDVVTNDAHIDRAEHEYRINQLKDRLKEMQRQVNLHHQPL